MIWSLRRCLSAGTRRLCWSGGSGLETLQHLAVYACLQQRVPFSRFGCTFSDPGCLRFPAPVQTFQNSKALCLPQGEFRAGCLPDQVSCVPHLGGMTGVMVVKRFLFLRFAACVADPSRE
jgi:hypothetical protein